MIFSNNASKIYERLDNVLRKDKNFKTSSILTDSIKQEIGKVLQTYFEIDINDAIVEILGEGKEMTLEYKIKIKRQKEFIYC